MWASIGAVGSVFTLIAFLAAVVAWILKGKSEERERLIKTATPEDRAHLVRDALEFVRVDASGLTKEAQFKLAMEQIHARAQRFKAVAMVICFLALVAAFLTSFAIWTSNQSAFSHVEKENGPRDPNGTGQYQGGTSTTSASTQSLDHVPAEQKYPNPSTFSAVSSTIDRLPAKLASLCLAPLDIDATVRPLAGHPVLKINGVRSFVEGVNVDLMLSHDKASEDSLTITGIKPIVWFNSQDAVPEYEIDASKKPPQGYVTSKRFLMTIASNQVRKVSWPDDQRDPAKLSEPDNLFKYQNYPSQKLELKKNDDTNSLEGSIRCVDPGTYDISFQVSYVVSGIIKSITTNSIRVVKR